MTLAPSGQVVDASVIHSSGSKELDDFMLDAVAQSHFPPVPTDLGQRGVTFIIPIVVYPKRSTTY